MLQNDKATGCTVSCECCVRAPTTAQLGVASQMLLQDSASDGFWPAILAVSCMAEGADPLEVDTNLTEVYDHFGTFLLYLDLDEGFFHTILLVFLVGLMAGWFLQGCLTKRSVPARSTAVLTEDAAIQSESLLLSDYVAMEIQVQMAESMLAQSDAEIEELKDKLAGVRRLHGNQAQTIADLKQEIEGMKRVHCSQNQHIHVLRQMRVLPEEMFFCPARGTALHSSDLCGHVQNRNSRRVAPCQYCTWPTAAEFA